MIFKRKTRWIIVFIHNHRMDSFCVYARNKRKAAKIGKKVLCDFYYQGAEIIDIKEHI